MIPLYYDGRAYLGQGDLAAAREISRLELELVVAVEAVYRERALRVEAVAVLGAPLFFEELLEGRHGRLGGLLRLRARGQ